MDLESMSHIQLRSLHKSKRAHPAKGSFALISSTAGHNEQIDGLYAALMAKKVPEKLRQIVKDRIGELIKTTSHAHRERLLRIAKRQNLESEFNRLADEHPLVDEEEKKSHPEPAAHLVRKIVADTAAMLLKMPRSRWGFQRLRQILPEGIFNTTIEELEK